MKHFTIAELTRSDIAAARGIDNTIPAEAEANLRRLAENVLDPLRELWGAPIYVNSGYRSAALNAAVGGVPTSEHLSGRAADITAGSPALNRELFALAASSGLPWRQLIDEKGYRWIHISHDPSRPQDKPRHL